MTFEDYNYNIYNEWILVNEDIDSNKKCKKDRKAVSPDNRIMEPTKRRL